MGKVMQKTQLIIGVDPGSKGAICVLNANTLVPVFIDLDQPVRAILAALKSVFDQYEKDSYVCRAAIERVASVPRVSAKSNFNFGYNVGGINWLLESLGIPLDSVPPKKWQAFIGIKPASTSIKKDVAAAVTRLYPSADIYGPRGGLIDGRSDSLGIAHYHYKNSL